MSIDTNTGGVTLIGGDYSGVLTNTISGLDYDSNGVLWGIAGSPFANVSIGTIDPATGTYTLIGTDSVGGLRGASFGPDDTLYSSDNGSPTDALATVNLTNATPTAIANWGVFTAQGVAVSDDGLFAYTIDATGNRLLRYDFTLGLVAAIGQTAANISALAFVGPTLFATTDDAADALITIDPLTGAELSRVALTSPLAQTAFINISALAAAPTGSGVTTPVPLPASGLLLIGGVGGLLALRRRARRA